MCRVGTGGRRSGGDSGPVLPVRLLLVVGFLGCWEPRSRCRKVARRKPVVEPGRSQRLPRLTCTFAQVGVDRKAHVE